MNSHLVSITDAAENAFVEALRNGGPLRAWIGLRDPDRDRDRFVDMDNGRVHWLFQLGPTAEPNNPTFEFWVEMFGGGTWNNNQNLDPIFPTNGYLVEYRVLRYRVDKTYLGKGGKPEACRLSLV